MYNNIDLVTFLGDTPDTLTVRLLGGVTENWDLSYTEDKTIVTTITRNGNVYSLDTKTLFYHNNEAVIKIGIIKDTCMYAEIVEDNQTALGVYP